MENTAEPTRITPMAQRFRGYLPVVVDVETGGFDWNRHALLELAAVPLDLDENGALVCGETASVHLHPAPGTEIDPKSLEVTGIDLDHPFRFAKQEKDALDHVFAPVRAAVKKHGCQRAILVGHNAHFDLNFLNAAVARVAHKRNPFHPFSVFDTVSLAGVAYGQTVLARAVQAAGFDWNAEDAHSAVYDAEQTARLFCKIVNAWPRHAASTPVAEPEQDTVTMYRPTGPEELALLSRHDFRRWPPRLPEQPIFYPVTNEQYAAEIAERWNIKDSGIGYVTRFRVRKDFMARYPIQKVGGAHHTEWWVPAEELELFNDNIVGTIEVIREFK